MFCLYCALRYSSVLIRPPSYSLILHCVYHTSPRNISLTLTLARTQEVAQLRKDLETAQRLVKQADVRIVLFIPKCGAAVVAALDIAITTLLMLLSPVLLSV